MQAKNSARATNSERTGSAEKSQRGPKDDRGVLADRILTAARELFATRGYAATSLRMIGEQAGVDTALVSYYFGSKSGLLDAALTLPEVFLEAITRAAATPLAERGHAMVKANLAMWDEHQPARAMQSIILTAVQEPLAMERLREIFAATLQTALAHDMPDDERALRASLVASQMMGLAMTRYIWKVGGIATIPSAQVEAIIAPTIQRYLTGSLDY